MAFSRYLPACRLLLRRNRAWRRIECMRRPSRLAQVSLFSPRYHCNCTTAHRHDSSRRQCSDRLPFRQNGSADHKETCLRRELKRPQSTATQRTETPMRSYTASLSLESTKSVKSSPSRGKSTGTHTTFVSAATGRTQQQNTYYM